MAKDKGIPVADESSGTIKKRFDKMKIELTVRRTRRSVSRAAAHDPRRIGLHRRA